MKIVGREKRFVNFCGMDGAVQRWYFNNPEAKQVRGGHKLINWAPHLRRSKKMEEQELHYLNKSLQHSHFINPSILHKLYKLSFLIYDPQASDWSALITWSEYWPLIGPDWSPDLSDHTVRPLCIPTSGPVWFIIVTSSLLCPRRPHRRTGQRENGLGSGHDGHYIITTITRGQTLISVTAGLSLVSSGSSWPLIGRDWARRSSLPDRALPGGEMRRLGNIEHYEHHKDDGWPGNWCC